MMSARGVTLEAVSVVAEFLPCGEVRPLSISWRGMDWPVDRVCSVGSALSCQEENDSRQGLKYRCVIAGRPSVLYLTESGWMLQVPAWAQ